MLLLNKYYVFINYEHYQYNEQVDHLQTQNESILGLLNVNQDIMLVI